MNQQLSAAQIRGTCRDLLGEHGKLSGRALRRELKRRFGAVGKTERVFRIWREECTRLQAAQAPGPSDAEELAQRLAEAEARAEEMKVRAERAEYREDAHQERWAAEVDQLRQRLRANETSAAEVRRLQDRVLELSRELRGPRPD
jgi:exonuclease SbcC